MQFYVVPALLMLFGATRIRDASASANANAKQQVLLDDNSSDSIGGNIPGWTSTATSSNSNNYRRHLLPDGADDTHFMECVLYLKVVDYADDHEEKSWSCKFTYEQAATFGGVDMMDIEGLTLEAIEAEGAISGETIIRVKTAYVEQFFRSNEGSSNSKTVLRIPHDSDFEVKQMEETDVRRAHNRRARRQRHRNLADSTPGTRKVLVVRVIDETGAKLNADAVQLENDLFLDEVCLKTQYAACSHDQLILEQATEFGTYVGGVLIFGMNVGGVFVNGIVDVTIDATAQNGWRENIEEKATAIATTRYGGDSTLGDTFDLVIFCLPPGTVDGNGKDWAAYSYINEVRSYYNDDYCQKVTTQMHEVGHNLNLAHSGIKYNEALAPYDDWSGNMGGGYSVDDDSPKMCFNAAKSFQLGWYEKQIKSINPLNYVSNPQTFVLNGVADYEKDGSNGDALVSLRLENKGLEEGVDYYIGYNRAIGANSGTLAAFAINSVTLLEKENLRNDYNTGLLGRDGYGQSWRLAAMEAGGGYRIKNYGGSIYDVVVTVNSINGKEAYITISTEAPKLFVCDPNFTKFQLKLKTDNYGTDTSWIIKGNDGTVVGESVVGGYADNYPNIYIFPSADEYYCLQDGECYTFTINDKFDDGICCYLGEGYYQGILDDVLKFEGGEFETSESKEWCVPSSDTNPPTTTPGPCTNSDGTVQINKNKTTTCEKLKNKGAKKKKKLCTKNAVFKACPGVCNIKCTCTDEKTFKLKGNKEKKYKCKNVGKKGQPECSGKVNNKTLVEDVCPKKCGVCF